MTKQVIMHQVSGIGMMQYITKMMKIKYLVMMRRRMMMMMVMMMMMIMMVRVMMMLLLPNHRVHVHLLPCWLDYCLHGVDKTPLVVVLVIFGDANS